MSKQAYLKEVASLFMKIGATAFGGPAAYIAIMQRETVRNRRWLDEQQFLDMVGTTNLIPGPNATEMAMWLGLVRAGGWGVVACYLLGFNEIALLFAGAAIVMLFQGGRRFLRINPSAMLLLPLLKVPLSMLSAGIIPFSQLTLFLTMLKIGAVIYGSGYVLLAFFQPEFVGRL